MEELRPAWVTACNEACMDPAATERWWGVIKESYAREGRVYHNEAYLAGLLLLYHQYEDKLTSPHTVALAIFFHKLEYCPRTGDGELRSLDQFKDFAREAGAEKAGVVEQVCGLLEACSRNLTEAHTTEGGSGADDDHYLLDMIVAVLGAPREDYLAYRRKIQAEYPHLSTQAYTQLRLRILQSLLLIPNVFATKDFQALYEAAARGNINAEIEELKKQ